MEEALKKRLIGAAVLASLAVIFVPMLFEEPPPKLPVLAPLPESPPHRDIVAGSLLEDIPAVTPLAPVRPKSEPKAAPKVVATKAGKPAPQKPRVALKAWVVQAAALSSRENANRLAGKLRAAKLPTPEPTRVDIKGKRFYRVMVGPVVERAEAQGMVDKVSRITGTRAQVKSYP